MMVRVLLQITLNNSSCSHRPGKSQRDPGALNFFLINPIVFQIGREELAVQNDKSICLVRKGFGKAVCEETAELRKFLVDGVRKIEYENLRMLRIDLGL